MSTRFSTTVIRSGSTPIEASLVFIRSVTAIVAEHRGTRACSYFSQRFGSTKSRRGPEMDLPAPVEGKHHRIVLVHVGDDAGTHLARSALRRLHERQVVDVDGIERTDFRDQLSDPASPACVVEPEQRDVRCVAPPSLQLVLRGDGVNDQRIERRRQRRRSLPAPPAQQVDLVTGLQQRGRLVLDADIRRERRLEQHEDPQRRLLSQPFPSRVPRSIRAEQHSESLESGVGSPALPPPRRSSPALLGHRSQPFEDVVSNRVGLEHLEHRLAALVVRERRPSTCSRYSSSR